MMRYRYVGLDKRLKGHTALGRFIESRDGWVYFLVQIDDLNHRWSHKWHAANRSHWEMIT